MTLPEADAAIMFKLILSLILIYIFQLSFAGKVFFVNFFTLLKKSSFVASPWENVRQQIEETLDPLDKDSTCFGDSDCNQFSYCDHNLHLTDPNAGKERLENGMIW